MGYKRTDHTVYVVHWPEPNVFKVGCSERQRWRMFTLRGAEIGRQSQPKAQRETTP